MMKTRLIEADFSQKFCIRKTAVAMVTPRMELASEVRQNHVQGWKWSSLMVQALKLDHALPIEKLETKSLDGALQRHDCSEATASFEAPLWD